jgi:hypothetical protein
MAQIGSPIADWDQSEDLHRDVDRLVAAAAFYRGRGEEYGADVGVNRTLASPAAIWA